MVARKLFIKLEKKFRWYEATKITKSGYPSGAKIHYIKHRYKNGKPLLIQTTYLGYVRRIKWKWVRVKEND